MSDVVIPIVVDTDPPSECPRTSSNVLDVHPSNGTLQDHAIPTQQNKHRNFLSGISEEDGIGDEIVPLDELDGHINTFEALQKTKPIPVRKTRSGASGSNASTKPSLLDNPKISTIRQHYYPEGGWGWMICACGFIIHGMTTGLLLSYGILSRELLGEFGEEYTTEAMWLGSMSLSTGLFVSPMIVAFCRRKSTRLTAVFGGLVSALGCLFTSFASQVHQVFFSYGFLMALGLGLARETSSLMIGQYFKRRRETVEFIIQSGTGLGVAVFSYVFSHMIRFLGWRLGLHAITGIIVMIFFIGIFYRSASLYHPQRRAILHLKNQRKKIKDKSGISDKPPFFDFTPLTMGSLVVTMVSSGICCFGLYAPFFHFVSILQAEGMEEDSILRLQLYLGIAFSVGCLVFGMLVTKRSAECMVAKHYLCQTAMIGCGIAQLCLFTLSQYGGYVLFVWMFGIFCGGLHYSLKMLVFEYGRAKGFGRSWAYVSWAQSLPVLFGIPATGYINRSQGERSGFYFSAACCFAGALAMTCINLYKYSYGVTRRGQGSCSTCTSQASSELRAQESLDTGICTCTGNSIHSNNSAANPAHVKCQKTISFASTVNIAEADDGMKILPSKDKHFVDCDLKNHWCNSDHPQSMSSSKAIEKFLVYDEGDGIQEVPPAEDFCGQIPRSYTFTECHCSHVDRVESPTVSARKRPTTVIEEATSAV